jgi:hypothetical protein
VLTLSQLPSPLSTTSTTAAPLHHRPPSSLLCPLPPLRSAAPAPFIHTWRICSNRPKLLYLYHQRSTPKSWLMSSPLPSPCPVPQGPSKQATFCPGGGVPRRRRGHGAAAHSRALGFGLAAAGTQVPWHPSAHGGQSRPTRSTSARPSLGSSPSDSRPATALMGIGHRCWGSSGHTSDVSVTSPGQGPSPNDESALGEHDLSRSGTPSTLPLLLPCCCRNRCKWCLIQCQHLFDSSVCGLLLVLSASLTSKCQMESL